MNRYQVMPHRVQICTRSDGSEQIRSLFSSVSVSENVRVEQRGWTIYDSKSNTTGQRDGGPLHSEKDAQRKADRLNAEYSVACNAVKAAGERNRI